jgi:hypothetical protein
VKSTVSHRISEDKEETTNLKKEEMFSICLKGIAEEFTFLMVLGWMQLMSLQRSSPFFNLAANDSFPKRSPVTASIHSLA